MSQSRPLQTSCPPHIEGKRRGYSDLHRVQGYHKVTPHDRFHLRAQLSPSKPLHFSAEIPPRNFHRAQARLPSTSRKRASGIVPCFERWGGVTHDTPHVFRLVASRRLGARPLRTREAGLVPFEEHMGCLPVLPERQRAALRLRLFWAASQICVAAQAPPRLHRHPFRQACRTTALAVRL